MNDLRLRPRAIAVLLALLGCATVASASELAVEGLGVLRGEIRARIRIVDLLDARTRNGVASGLPLTVRFTADLWRERRHWFDQHVEARVETFRIRWDPRERIYTLLHPGPGHRIDSYERLDDLLEDLGRREIPIHPRWALEDGSRYFAVLEIAVRPMTLEDFRELDGWIEGRLRGDTEPGDVPSDGQGEGLSGAVLGLLLNLSGFGDEILRTRTPSFRPADLADLEPVPGG